jgi:DNA-directed RNA polymerase specialized sigma24 family protein
MPDPSLQDRCSLNDPQLAGLSDERLLELFHTQHREDCFAELTRRYLDSAFRLAFMRCGRRELAEEAVQEAFYRLSRKETAFPSGTPAPFKLRLLALVSLSARNSLRSERRKAQRPCGAGVIIAAG